MLISAITPGGRWTIITWVRLIPVPGTATTARIFTRTIFQYGTHHGPGGLIMVTAATPPGPIPTGITVINGIITTIPLIASRSQVHGTSPAPERPVRLIRPKSGKIGSRESVEPHSARQVSRIPGP